MQTLKRILNLRLWALFVKEFHQIRRNRRLVILLIIPPTLNIVLFGLALNPTFENLRLGVVDDSRTPESRELISAFQEGLVFKVQAYYASANQLGDAISRGDLDAGLVVPRDFAETRARRETAEVQLIVDAVNANTATIAGGYAARIVAQLNQKISASRPSARQPGSETPDAGPVSLNTDAPRARPTRITPRMTLLYNPGLKSAWFITTGMIGLLLVLQGSVVSAASLVREKEIGTIEQLLMTPATGSEIIVAKVLPIFLLLAVDIGLALLVARLAFGVPMRGSIWLFFLSASLCVVCGIGLGMMIATFTRTQQQAQLMSFFTNPPLAILSGATTPIEAMPAWLQPVTAINPVKHFAIISRSILLKGSGIDVLYPQLLALAVIAVVMISVSAWRFRKQLG
ncbi:MAG TPA: ABC transporter permease [Pyrinomonadaceae bacterium]|nr:ABC transporter permease [Pyrinomonadaceae bacterium]